MRLLTLLSLMKLERPANSAENELLVSSLFVVLLLSARTFVESWQQRVLLLMKVKRKRILKKGTKEVCWDQSESC